MKTSRILLRLLVLAGSLIILFRTGHPTLATYEADCYQYNSKFTDCPAPCSESYQVWNQVQPGPYWISGTQWLCNDDPNLDCTSYTETSAQLPPSISLACGCGNEGDYCAQDSNCCGGGTLLCDCLTSQCATCLQDGDCEICGDNTQCCNGCCGNDFTCGGEGCDDGGGDCQQDGGNCTNNSDCCNLDCNQITGTCGNSE